MDRTNLHYDSSQKTVGKCVLGVFWGGALFGFKMRDSKPKGSKREKADPLLLLS